MIYNIDKLDSDNNVLRDIAIDIELNSDIELLINDLRDTLNESTGVGLAAPQIGISARLFIIQDHVSPIIFINPKIIKTSDDSIELIEGCLSLPGINAPVVRPISIQVEYYNESWELINRELSGLNAIIFQHELDHLDGILFIDRLSRFWKHKINKKKYENYSSL